MASIELKYDARNPIARKTIEYVLSLGLFENVSDKKSTTGAGRWQQAIDEGACSVEQFGDDLKALIAQWPEDHA